CSIAELEHSIGARLLERSRQGVEPTEYGWACSTADWRRSMAFTRRVREPSLFANPTVGEIWIGEYHPDVPTIIKTKKPVKTLMQIRNNQRSWGNRAIRVRAARLPKSVPDSRSSPLFSDHRDRE